MVNDPVSDGFNTRYHHVYSKEGIFHNIYSCYIVVCIHIQYRYFKEKLYFNAYVKLLLRSSIFAWMRRIPPTSCCPPYASQTTALDRLHHDELLWQSFPISWPLCELKQTVEQRLKWYVYISVYLYVYISICICMLMWISIYIHPCVRMVHTYTHRDWKRTRASGITLTTLLYAMPGIYAHEIQMGGILRKSWFPVMTKYQTSYLYTIHA